MGAFSFSECILVSSEVSHLIATLVKRLWLSYTTGLHIPATRWIGILPKESPDRCGTCAICRTATAACLFTTSGSVVFLEFSHSQEDKPMNNDITELRLTAIEAAIKTISAAICANEGPLSDDLHNQIQLLRDQLSNPENTVKQEAITYQTIKLLDSLNCDPWDPF
ncbi:hypothetical protein ACJ0NJ_01280 [Enterobacter hormaechei]|uniref:hypothetical protein n=2 Tax=Enterobacter TaxID=547 RepID=UPI00388672A5